MVWCLVLCPHRGRVKAKNRSFLYSCLQVGIFFVAVSCTQCRQTGQVFFCKRVYLQFSFCDMCQLSEGGSRQINNFVQFFLSTLSSIGNPLSKLSCLKCTNEELLHGKLNQVQMLFCHDTLWNSWQVVAACRAAAGEVRGAGSDANEVATLWLRDCCRVG